MTNTTRLIRDETLYRLAGITLAIAGVCTALFWVLAALLGTFAGADVVLRASWAPAQMLHVIGAMLAIFGFMGVYAAQRQETGVLGLIGFVLAVVGTALFVADGLIALGIFPALAIGAPALLSVSGAINSGAVLILFIVIAATNMVGQIAFGAATWRAGVFPRGAAGLFVIGGILFNLPPGPVPMIALALGGILWSAAAVWLGLALHRKYK